MEALSFINKERKNKIKLHVIGGNTEIGYEKIIKNKINELDLSADTIFHGWLKQDQIIKIFNNSSIFVLPSNYETLPVSLIEAMACGTPVITSNAGALPEVTGEAAVQIDPRAVNQLSEAMQILLSDARLRNKLREKGLERVNQFSWEESAGRIWEVLIDHA